MDSLFVLYTKNETTIYFSSTHVFDDLLFKLYDNEYDNDNAMYMKHDVMYCITACYIYIGMEMPLLSTKRHK